MFKGKLSEGCHADPASWKTRLRVALNKSPEFREEPERSQLEISEPYKVYRLVPINEQGETSTHAVKLCLFISNPLLRCSSNYLLILCVEIYNHIPTIWQ